MAFGDGARYGHNRGNSVGGPVGGMVHRPSLADSVRTDSGVSTRSNDSTTSLTDAIEDEKPIAKGNGIAVSIALTEPVLFLQGFDQSDLANRTTTMLRGRLHLKVTKAAKIKAITLKFRGRSETEWPEGDTALLQRCRAIMDFADQITRYTTKEDRVQGYGELYGPHLAILQCSVPKRRK
jgi:hypothetical protein